MTLIVENEAVGVQYEASHEIGYHIRNDGGSHHSLEPATLHEHSVEQNLDEYRSNERSDKIHDKTE